MPNVLLIADSPRLKKIFETAEGTGIITLRSAGTLAQAEQEIATEFPAVTFVQSRISGLSVDLVLLHLKKMLPQRARIVLATAERDEVEIASRQQLHCLDLSMSDDEVMATIHDAISGVFSAPAGAPPAAPSAQVPLNSTESDEFFLSDPVAPGEADAPRRDEPEDFVVFSQTAEPQPPKTDFQELLKGKEESSATHAYPRLTGDFTYAKPLSEAMRDAEEERRSNWLLPTAVGLVLVVAVCFFAFRKGEKDAKEALPKTAPALRRRSDTPSSSPKATPAPAAAVATASAKGPTALPGNPPQAAVKPVSPAVAASVAKSASAPASVKPGPPVAVPPVKKQISPAGLPAPAAPPVAKQSAVPNASPPSPSAVHAAGRPLPAVVAAAGLDPSYEKNHPGWQKYVGSGAEFKVFRQGGGVKAVQVIATGDAIHHALLKRLLHEFAGVEGYRVQSRGTEAKYLVERGEAKPGVGVTVYRRKGDQKMRALVIFYR